jgi:hypothetical protein
VAGRVALLVAHLGGRAYSLRSAIVTALGHLVAKGFEGGPGEDADAPGARHLSPAEGLTTCMQRTCRALRCVPASERPSRKDTSMVASAGPRPPWAELTVGEAA